MHYLIVLMISRCKMKKSEIIAYLNGIFAEKQARASAKAEANIQKLQRDKNFIENDRNIKILTAEIGKKKAFNEDKKTIQNLSKVLDNYKQEHANILKKYGMTEKDITPQYECKKCSDTGRVHGKPCDCYKKEYYKLLLINSNISTTLASFDLFDEKLLTNQNQKETLIKCKNFLNSYVSKYPSVDKHTIMLSGKTGVGKTFLAQCTANEFIKKGILTLFISAFNMNNNFLKYHTTFTEDKQSYYEMVYEPDVLIIDDLGTEPLLKNVTTNYLCSLLNDRYDAKKITIITTNFGPSEISAKYGERIFSRLFNKADSLLIKIDGDDLRIKQKK